MLRRDRQTRLITADGVDYDAAKDALQPLIDDDEQVLSYRRLED